MKKQHPAIDHFLKGAGDWQKELPRLDKNFSSQLAALNEKGAEAFCNLAQQPNRIESWKYTKLSSVLKQSFAPAADHEGLVFDDLPEEIRELASKEPTLVFINGNIPAFIRKEPPIRESLRANIVSEANQEQKPEARKQKSDSFILASESGLLRFARNDAYVEGYGLTCMTALQLFNVDVNSLDLLGQIADASTNPLAALNTAHVTPGAFFLKFHNLDGEANQKRRKPVHLVFLSIGGEEPSICHPRVFVVVDENTEAALIEHHISLNNKAPILTNLVTEISLRPGAVLHHIKLQQRNPQDYHFSHTAVRAEQNSRYESFSWQSGSALARDEIAVELAETGASCELLGAYKAKDAQHIDNATLINHTAPHCTSNEVYKGVLDGKARGVFQGKIVVNKGAVKTDANQLSKTLLLSDAAEADGKPELEIHEDDVKCSHGATVGELDENALFYLRSRGIKEETARQMLIQAFLVEVIEDIKDTATREYAFKLLSEELQIS